MATTCYEWYEQGGSLDCKESLSSRLDECRGCQGQIKSWTEASIDLTLGK